MTLKTVSTCFAATFAVLSTAQFASAQSIDCTLAANAELAECLNLPETTAGTTGAAIGPIIAPLAAAALLGVAGGLGGSSTTSTVSTVD